MPHEHELVPIRFYDDPLEAHMARCILENEGIAAFVHDEHIVGLNRLFSYAVGGVKLKVQEDDRSRALNVLDMTEHRPFLDDNGSPVTCPQCGSTDLATSLVAPPSAKNLFQWMFAVLFAVYPISVEHRLQCNQCHHILPRRADGPEPAGPRPGHADA